MLRQVSLQQLASPNLGVHTAKEIANVVQARSRAHDCSLIMICSSGRQHSVGKSPRRSSFDRFLRKTVGALHLLHSKL